MLRQFLAGMLENCVSESPNRNPEALSETATQLREVSHVWFQHDQLL
jgi:hypothetical protein